MLSIVLKYSKICFKVFQNITDLVYSYIFQKYTTIFLVNRFKLTSIKSLFFISVSTAYRRAILLKLEFHRENRAHRDETHRRVTSTLGFSARCVRFSRWNSSYRSPATAAILVSRGETTYKLRLMQHTYAT